jgi:hypothetical protein
MRTPAGAVAAMTEGTKTAAVANKHATHNVRFINFANLMNGLY